MTSTFGLQNSSHSACSAPASKHPRMLGLLATRALGETRSMVWSATSIAWAIPAHLPWTPASSSNLGHRTSQSNLENAASSGAVIRLCHRREAPSSLRSLGTAASAPGTVAVNPVASTAGSPGAHLEVCSCEKFLRSALSALARLMELCRAFQLKQHSGTVLRASFCRTGSGSKRSL